MKVRVRPQFRSIQTARYLRHWLDISARLAGAATENTGPRGLPDASPSSSSGAVPPFASHQFQPDQPERSAELESADDDVGWFFAEDDTSTIVVADVSPVLPPDLSLNPVTMSALATASASAALATPASMVGAQVNRGSEALGTAGDGYTPQALTHSGRLCRCGNWNYIGPTACDFRAGTCCDCRTSAGAEKGAGSAWHLRFWRALRCAATGLHHGQPDMMELALATALLLAVDSETVCEPTHRSGNRTNSEAPPLPWLGLSQVSVMRMLGGAEMDWQEHPNFARTNSQSGCRHYVIAGLVLNVSVPDAPGQLHSIRVAMRVHHSVHATAAQSTSSRNIVDGICCATVDGAIPSPGDELSHRQVDEILDSCHRLGLLAASGNVDCQVVQWCTARGVIVLDNMPRHSFHKLVSLCGSRAVHSFRRIKQTHTSLQLLRLELWEQRGWYCGTGSPCPEDTVGTAGAFHMPRSNMLAVSVAQKSSLSTQLRQNTSNDRDRNKDSSTVYARGVKPHVTVILCASTDAAATVYEAGFWKCLGRLQSTISTGAVLPGAGCFELHAAEALRVAQIEQEQRYLLHQNETDISNNTDEAYTGFGPGHVDAESAESLQTSLAYGGFQRALEQVVRQALHNYQAPSHAEACERLERASAAVQSHMRAQGDGSLLPLPWQMWQPSCPLLRQQQICTDAARGSAHDTFVSVDQSYEPAHTASAAESHSDPEYELVLDDLQAKRSALIRAAEFLRVCLLTDVLDLQTWV
eukprot:COSAG02_NODE_2354_length_9081_cov_4.549544_3_plen_754_part_00